MEETRPGQYMPVFEDERGLYLFNSRDLALYEYIPELKNAGVDSVKIEGRMKSIHYLATIVSFYRQVLDGKEFSPEQAQEMLNRVPNRGYSAGFMKGWVDRDDYQYHQSTSHSESVFVGNITEEKIDGRSIMEVRNKIYTGEELEVLSPDGSLSTAIMPQKLTTTEGQDVDFANHSQFILMETEMKPYTLLRRVEK